MCRDRTSPVQQREFLGCAHVQGEGSSEACAGLCAPGTHSTLRERVCAGFAWLLLLLLYTECDRRRPACASRRAGWPGASRVCRKSRTWWNFFGTQIVTVPPPSSQQRTQQVTEHTTKLSPARRQAATLDLEDLGALDLKRHRALQTNSRKAYYLYVSCAGVVFDQELCRFF